ncbi:MAG: PEP-utilizing enzyme [Desulfurivibrionaceae bacterium]
MNVEQMRDDNRLDITLTEFREFVGQHSWRKMGSWERENFGTIFFDASKSIARYAKFGITVAPPAVLRIGNDGYICENAISKYVDFHLVKLRDKNYSYYDGIRAKQQEMLQDLVQKTSEFKARCDFKSFLDFFEIMATLHVLFDFDRSLSDAIEIELAKVRCEIGDNNLASEYVWENEHESQAVDLVRKLREVKLRAVNGEPFRNDLILLAEKFGHLGFYQFRGRAFSPDDLEEMMNNVLPRTTMPKSTKNKTPVDDRFGAISQLAGRFSAHRLQRVEAANSALYLLRNSLAEFFNSRGVTAFMHLVYPQVKPAANGLLESTGLRAHEKTVIYVSSLRVYRLNLEEVDEFKGEFSVDLKQSVLRGTRASAGICKGRARIVLDPSGCKDFCEGDVLVCSMTDPNFLPLMLKAGAFVTEKGGILCHAAILARELQKPCLIGVKGLLVSVIDGNIVEVDCNSEILTVL